MSANRLCVTCALWVRRRNVGHRGRVRTLRRPFVSVRRALRRSGRDLCQNGRQGPDGGPRTCPLPGRPGESSNEAAAKLEPLAQNQPDLQAELAELAFRRGDYKAAKSRAEAALKLDRRQSARPLDRRRVGPGRGSAGRGRQRLRVVHPALQRPRHRRRRVLAPDRHGVGPLRPLEPPGRPIRLPGQHPLPRRVGGRPQVLAGPLRGGGCCSWRSTTRPTRPTSCRRPWN